MRASPRDVTALAIGLLSISVSAIVIRFCASAPELIAFYRLAGAGLVFLLVGLVRDRTLRLPHRDMHLAVVAGIFLAAHFYLWISSLFMTTIYASVVLVASQPLFALILQAVFRKMPVGPRNIISLVAGLTGAALIAGGDLHLSGGLAGRGDLLAISGAAMIAIYLFIGSYRSGHLIPYLGWVYSVAAFVMLAVVFATGVPLIPAAQTDWLWFIVLALVPTLIGHSILNRSMKFFPAYFVNLSVLVEPILTSIWAWLIFRELLRANVVAGGLLIVVAVAIEVGRRTKWVPGEPSP